MRCCGVASLTQILSGRCLRPQCRSIGRKQDLGLQRKYRSLAEREEEEF
jgi:hypothetical protein